MNIQPYSEAQSETERIVAVREDLFFATDKRGPIRIETLEDFIVNIQAGWDWDNFEVFGLTPSNRHVSVSLGNIRTVVNV